MSGIRAIETQYQGYRFRSRLEARWAVFLDTIGVRWEYEKQGYSLPSGPYLPDFWLPLPADMADRRYPGSGYWLEVKPCEPTEREQLLLIDLAVHTGHNAFMVAGNVGAREHRTYKAICIRSMRALAHYAERSTSIMLSTSGEHPRYDETGNLHPDDYCGALVDRSDPVEFGFPFSELTTLMPDALDMGAFGRAYAAARSARFEHGETP